MNPAATDVDPLSGRRHGASSGGSAGQGHRRLLIAAVAVAAVIGVAPGAFEALDVFEGADGASDDATDD